jgi:hypothetical protein
MLREIEVESEGKLCISAAQGLRVYNSNGQLVAQIMPSKRLFWQLARESTNAIFEMGGVE